MLKFKIGLKTLYEQDYVKSKKSVFGKDFKAKIVLEALREKETLESFSQEI